MTEHARRFEDTNIGKLIYSYPALVGVALLLMSIGGYIVTINLQDKHLEKIDHWIDMHEKQDGDQARVIQHLADLADAQNQRADAMDRRVSTIEIHFNELLQRIGHPKERR
jgi:oligoribonuclease (3'-5' exoribonuclease)